ncbi:hypothetical protein CK203_071910 [Vitis vinifera]|uniref:BIRD-IDD transcription factor fourth C2HC zinc finger domain-containing protein n=1 Tax=Vitis vinifera TaxID=29760 RepID=A0A438F440_VITVI|nr:hypothetical protein CK203_071910 [Vitis vinifera]
MQFNQIGRLTLKPVELENTDVTAEPFSPDLTEEHGKALHGIYLELKCSGRKDSFITHRAFCDALAEESARLSVMNSTNQLLNLHPQNPSHFRSSLKFTTSKSHHPSLHNFSKNNHHHPTDTAEELDDFTLPKLPRKHTAHLGTPVSHCTPPEGCNCWCNCQHLIHRLFTISHVSPTHGGAWLIPPRGRRNLAGVPGFRLWKPFHVAKKRPADQDFLGLTGESGGCGGGGGGGGGSGGGADGAVNVSVNMRDMLQYTGGVEFQPYDRDHSLLKAHGFETWGDC